MKLRDRLDRMGERAPVISQIVKFQSSVAYPILYALICAVAGVSDKSVYVPLIYVITAFVVFSGFFSKECKVFIVPAMISYYAVGLDVSERHYNKLDSPAVFDMSVVPHFVICGTLMVGVFIFRLILNGAFKNAFLKRGIFFGGIAFLGIAIMTNGAFSSTWKPQNLLFGFISCVALVLIYMLFLSALSDSKDAVGFACKTLVCASVAVSLQIAVIIYRLAIRDNLIVNFGKLEYFNRTMLNLSWGLATIVGGVIALGIPAAMYLARTRKYPFLSYSIAVVLFAVTVIINTRSAMLFGAFMLVLGILFCISGGKNKRFNRIFTALLAVCGIVASGVFAVKYSEESKGILTSLMDFMRLGFVTGSATLIESLGGRAELWVNGLRDFTNSVLFGSGFSHSAWTGIEAFSDNFYRHTYHNIFIEFLGHMGLVGIVAFLVHLKHMLEVAVRKFSIEKLMILCVPILIILMSFFDSFFFYPNFQLVYAILLVVAELELEKKRRADLDNVKSVPHGKKPKVVFTYVEAGKGHIVPTQTVYKAFSEKYGDRAEIVESHFFGETDNENMKKTEVLFEKAVQNQARSPLLGILCWLGNFVAGDTFALTVLLSWTISGRKTAPLAIKHAEELDADVIFTAHWSIPYYVNKIKGIRPRTVCFCPDVYSNGAFNVDCNRFLISGNAGYKKIERRRMYAGGNIRQVAFPMRESVMEYASEGGKQRARRELGIDEGAFVVTLSDGGYGLARLEKTVMALMQSKQRMTVIALCGTNKELYERLCKLRDEARGEVTLLPVGFTTAVAAYIAAADVYAGKSGANSMAEPCALGVPMVITKCITYIERGIKDYYAHDLGCAVYIPNSKRAARFIEGLAADPSAISEKFGGVVDKASLFDAESVADEIWQEALAAQRSKQ